MSGPPRGELPDLRGRVAIVTGGSRGIGLAIADAFVRAGATVALLARDRERLDEVVQSFHARHARVLPIAGDVADRDVCLHAVQTVGRDFGPVDALVNAAGIQGPIGPLETIDATALRETLEVNLLGTIWMMQAVIPGMRERGRGAIVNLSGGGATSARARFAAYAASKVAVVRVTETAASELHGTGVRVNAIAPGAVNTHMTDEVERAGGLAGEQALEEVRRQRESGGVDPAVPAALAAWLASDAAAHLNGRLISAVWDDWRALIASGSEPPPNAMTLRRV